MTAIPLSDVKKHIKITGADVYFLKPFKMPEFIKLFDYL